MVRKNLRYSSGASDDTVFVVKSPQDRAGEDGNSPVEVVPASLQRLEHGTGLWDTRAQGRVGPASVVVGPPRCQDFPQVPFAQWNDPIEALPPQGSDQPLAERISLRAMHRRDYHFKSKPRQRSVQLRRKDRVVVVDDEAILVV